MTTLPGSPPLPDSVGWWREFHLDPSSAAETPAPLDPAERRPELIDVRCDAPRILSSLRVAVIGAGSIGLRVVDSLARMGIAEIAICDGRATKRESLLTHPIHRGEIGVQKALLAARRAKEISPATRVRHFAGPFEALSRDALADAAFVCLCTDNLLAEVAVGQASRHLAVPMLQASVYGRALVAQVRHLSNGDESGPCGPCGFTADEWELLDRDVRFSCEPPADASPLPQQTGAAPTASFPHLCAEAADLLVGELLRRALGLDEHAAPDELVELRGYRGMLVRTRLARRAECPLDHRTWRSCVSHDPLESLTPRDSVRIGGYADSDLGRLTLSVERHRFAALQLCGCSAHQRVGRFVPDGSKLPYCQRCQSQPVPHPLHSHREIPGRALEHCLDRPLGDLGARLAPTILVDGPRGVTLVRAVHGSSPS